MSDEALDLHPTGHSLCIEGVQDVIGLLERVRDLLLFQAVFRVLAHFQILDFVVYRVRFIRFQLVLVETGLKLGFKQRHILVEVSDFVVLIELRHNLERLFLPLWAVGTLVDACDVALNLGEAIYILDDFV